MMRWAISPLPHKFSWRGASNAQEQLKTFTYKSLIELAVVFLFNINKFIYDKSSFVSTVFLNLSP
jgi:hypothetical protein